MPDRRLYGRDDLIDQIARAEARLVLVTGDSGVGKSEVLNASSDPRDGWVNAPPHQLAPSSGALHRGVLLGLADVASQVVEARGDIQELKDSLLGVAGRMVSVTSRELATAVTSELVSLIRGRLGPDAGRAISELARSVLEAKDDTLVNRIYAVMDESMAETLAGFTAEVVGFADRHVSLSLDAGERLGHEECRLLADFAGKIVDRCHVRLAWVTDSPENRGRIAELLRWTPAAYEIVVPPLDADSIVDWLADESLLDLSTEEVLRATGGYPLHVDDLIGHLHQGGAIEDAPLNEQVVRRVEASWHDLSVDAAAAARSLCVLPDPLSEELLRELTDLDPPRFGQVLQELQWARIFPTEVNGLPWFHEQRRAFVRRQLSERELDAASTAAAELISRDLLPSTDDYLWMKVFADLTRDSRSMREQDPKLDAVHVLTETELAISAALLELIIPPDQLATSGADLVRHARRFTTELIEPAAVLARLEELNLVVTASNEHAIAVVPSWTGQAAAVILGRAQRELLRTPIPAITTAAYQLALIPRLKLFDDAQFGVGRPSIGSLARMAAGGDPSRGRSGYINRRTLPRSLIARASLGGRPIYSSARFAEDARRDDAVHELENLRIEVLGQEFAIQEVLPQPLEPVPTLRFKAAVQLAFQLPHLSDTGDLRVELSDSITFEQVAERRATTKKFLKENSSLGERRAMDLDEAINVCWDENESGWIECTVEGGPDASMRVPGLLAASGGDTRFRFFDLEQQIGLGHDATIRSIRWGSRIGLGRYDPVLSEIGDRRERARLYNTAQALKRVVLDEDNIVELLTKGFVQRMVDARSALESLPVEAARRDLPTIGLYVLIALEEPSVGWVAGALSMTHAIERVSTSGDDEVHVEFVRGTREEGGWPQVHLPQGDLFDEHFGFSPNRSTSGLLHGHSCNVLTLLSGYMGYSEQDLDFRWPGQQ